VNDETFLSPKEVAELTGIKTGKNINGVTVHREELQVNQLRTQGIPFTINARGRPIVVRAVLVGAAPQAAANEAKPRWEPKASKRAA